ncbi:hypothetical protein BJX63DRAFT_66488 [Aspergillus granulosus]|uniref:Uncharacterized protein n=1 Tax=Aspergillus granulosus TaxID=176169 RepID=A0ABR4GYH7_9EURO
MGRLPDIESNVEFDDQPPQCQSWTSMIIWCVISYCCMLIIFISVCCSEYGLLKFGLLPLFVHGSPPALFYAFSQSHGHFSKPKGVEIIALVPFQEVQETEILDCYLLRNLASNGGLLDQVMFIPQTNHTDSLKWLATTVERTSSYAISDWNDFPFATANKIPNALYIWIDGAVFLEEHTIPTMVKTKLEHPDSLIVSANVVNEGPLEKLHSHPSITRSSVFDQRSRGTPVAPEAQIESSSSLNGDRLSPSGEDEFERTPIGKSISSKDGPGFGDWTVKAQQHYSFLYHVKLGNLYGYKFPMWTNPTGPISTYFFCFMGHDAAAVELFIRRNGSLGRAPEIGGDGIHRVKDTIIIDGKGLVAHYSSKPGLEKLRDTDVLQRYGSYARENICPNI